MKRFGQPVAILCLALVCFVGCGQAKVPETIESSVVAVSSRGQITAYVVEDFGKAYYDLTELSSMAAEEVSEFNDEKQSDGKWAVAMDGVEPLEDGKVKVTYRFSGWEAYTEFNEEMIFYGPVSEADEKGYIGGASLKSVKDGTLMDEALLKQNSDRKVIITNVRADIYCPASVAYVSEGVSVNADGSVAATQAEGLVYILLK